MSENNFNLILDAFVAQISGGGAKIECKICGWKAEVSYYIGTNNFDDPILKVNKTALEHLAFKHNIGMELYCECIK